MIKQKPRHKVQRIRQILSAFIHAPETNKLLNDRIGQLVTQLDETNKLCRSVQSGMEALESFRSDYYRLFWNDLDHDDEGIKRLNRMLSTHPTIWGEPSRLHISPSASVDSCLFNTNSGEIVIGDYSFAGSGVSVLAGSHDKELKGFLRRDAEFTEGYDILIGKGVWLASGCTILGPCRIHDNAVIAAGAVVAPGTEIPEGAVYGGIPAKEIGRVTGGNNDVGSDAVIRALKRNGDVLFFDGWSEKKYFDGIDGTGHYLLEKEGIVLTARPELVMHFGLTHQDGAEICLSGSFGKKSIELSRGISCFTLETNRSPGSIETVTISTAGKEAGLFLQIPN